MDENGLEIEIVDTVTADAYYEAYYTNEPIYEPDPDDPDDPTDDPDDIVVNQNPGSNDVTVDVTDKNDDDKVEIPMGPILEETGKTYEDVDFVVTRKEDTEDGNDTYTYDITFRVDGEDVDIESLGTEDANKITVTVPELDPGHEYVVEVYNPETGKFEELDEDQYTYTTDENGNPVIEVNTPWYTEIKVTEKILTFTVIFKYTT